MTDSNLSSDRRQGDRQTVMRAAQIQLPDAPPSLALIHDLSSTGALLYSGAAFEPGAILPLRLALQGNDHEPVAAEGEVVRCTVRDGNTLWRHEIAVRFARPIDNAN